MFDVAKHLGAVTRAVEDSTHEGTPVKVVVASRTYPTDAADLWSAVTDPDRIPRWFAPVSGDLRLGGRFQVEGNAGGEVITCDEPKHLAITWEFGGETSWVDVHLAEDGGSTTLTLRHAADVSGNEHWPTYGPGGRLLHRRRATGLSRARLRRPRRPRAPPHPRAAGRRGVERR